MQAVELALQENATFKLEENIAKLRGYRSILDILSNKAQAIFTLKQRGIQQNSPGWDAAMRKRNGGWMALKNDEMSSTDRAQCLSYEIQNILRDNNAWGLKNKRIGIKLCAKSTSIRYR